MSVVAEAPVWRVPPRWVLLVALLSIACAEIGGASMARFKVELTRWARDGMLARPAVHGLVGVRDVDERILDEALVKFDAGLRLFHMHAEGMGLVIIATTMVAATVAPFRAGPPVDHRASHDGRSGLSCRLPRMERVDSRRTVRTARRRSPSGSCGCRSAPPPSRRSGGWSAWSRSA